jgi:hypothetical protein
MATEWPSLDDANDESLKMIQRVAATNTKTFLSLLEESYQWDDDVNNLDLDNLDAFRGKKEKKSKGEKKKRGVDFSSFEMHLAAHEGETVEIKTYPKLVVSCKFEVRNCEVHALKYCLTHHLVPAVDAPEIRHGDSKILSAQTAWVETPDKPLRTIKVPVDSLMCSNAGFVPMMEDAASSSSSGGSEASDDSNEELMALDSDQSSDDFNQDLEQLEKDLMASHKDLF